jgi:transcriptional regulator with XRE-family HTH domain
VAIQLEFKREQLGLSQREFAGLAGITQGTYSNAIRGHDPISSAVVNRLRDALLSAR